MQSQRRTQTDRLILMLGILVALLALLIVGLLIQGAPLWPGSSQPDLAGRAQQQLTEYVGRDVEVRYAEPGRGLALCGYAGRRGQTRAFSFISRPNRIITSDDPLPIEFNEMMASFCPDFARRPGVLAISQKGAAVAGSMGDPAPAVAPVPAIDGASLPETVPTEDMAQRMEPAP